MQPYQYLVVYHLTSTERAGFSDQTWTRTYELWRPGAAQAETRSGDLPLATILNDLGREGWRLVASDVVDTVVVSANYGWPESGMPLRQRWTFIRTAAGV